MHILCGSKKKNEWCWRKIITVNARKTIFILPLVTGINECRSDLMFCILRFDFLIKMRDLFEVYIYNRFWCIVCSILTLKIRMKFISFFTCGWSMPISSLILNTYCLFYFFSQLTYIHKHIYILTFIYKKFLN